MQFALWEIAPGKILTRQELGLVLVDLKQKAERSRNGRLNLVLFRLACCCGLRVSEIAKLCLGDVDLASRRHYCNPTLRARSWWHVQTFGNPISAARLRSASN